jgi:hemerythrin-like domain-containing protein
MAVQIGAKPDSGFDDPIGMLTDCHRRIEHFLGMLCLVAQRSRGRGLTEEESAAVDSALQYFRVGGQRHTADEELSLFPRLREWTAADDSNEIVGLESDHQEANDLHSQVEKLFTGWITSGRLSDEDQSRLESMTQRLKRLYEEHIRVEEQVVFPRAASRLDRQTLTAIGNEFRARRI